MNTNSNAFDVKNKKILVLGLAKTGLSVVRHLASLGAIITVNDWTPIDKNPDAQQLVEENIRVISGGHPTSLLDEAFELIVKNPGIPYSNPMIVKAQALGIPIITDIECSYLLTSAPIIGITGSNGKTTTTQLTYNILSSQDSAEQHTYLGGNIGIPSLDVAQKATANDRLVFELSSFQLMGTKKFHPYIAAITNIYPSHIDYHGTVEEYIDAKWKITANQTADDYLILNADQDGFGARKTDAQIVYFSVKQELSDGTWYDAQNQLLMWKEDKVASRADFPLPGEHNVANALVAITIAKIIGLTNEQITAVLKNYHGVDHRLQFVTNFNGRKFFNDSKATNNEATITALKSFDTPVIWLAGGLDRGNSVTDLAEYLTHVKGMIAFGQSKDKFVELAKEHHIPLIGVAEDMDEIVKLAYTNSASGDTILLSPASASWDQYANFEERGSKFVQAVTKLENIL